MDELLRGFDDPAPAATPTPAPTTSDSELDDLLDDFDDENTDTPQSAIGETAETKNWEITTLTALSSSYSYQQKAPVPGAADYRGFTRLKIKLQPELRYKFNPDWDSVFSISSFYDFSYTLKDRSTFTSEALTSNESQLEVFELYFRGTISHSFDIKAGRQIVVWGKSDSLRVVDILNPLDLREPGMVDIEDLRLPVTMVKADYYIGDWNISAMVIPEIRFNKMPAYGSDFYLGGNFPPLAENIPDDVSNPEYALAFIGNFTGWDLSLHLADYYDDQPYFVRDNGQPSLAHARLNMAGAAANFAKGSWLLKSEAAYIDGLKFADTSNTYSRADAMVGIDYNGIADMIFSIETSNQHIMKYQAVLNSPFNNTLENQSQISLRYSATFMREKLAVMILTSFFGTSPKDGGFYRASFDYEIDDAMSIIFGGIIYQSGDSLVLKSMASNDRVFMDYRYTF